MNERCRRCFMVLMASVAFQTTAFLGGPCFAQTNDFAVVRRLSTLKGKAYKELRDQLTKRGKKWDQEMSLKGGWEAGLTAYVLNARIANPEIFDDLDKISLSQTRSGRPWFASSISEGEAWQAFVIEQTWKRFWPDELSDTMIERSLMNQDVVGSTNLWQALSVPAVKPSLRAVGIYALCKHEEFSQRAAELLFDDDSPSIVKSSILKGMSAYRPQYARGLLIENMSKLKDDDQLRHRGILLLACDEADASREALHEWLQDDQLSETMRTEIVNALSANPKASDADVYRNLLRRESLAGKVRETVQKVLKEKSE